MSGLDWSSFTKNAQRVPALGFLLDFSTVRGLDDASARLAPAFETAFEEMKALESGAVANPDEGRQVGHYWLRDARLAPTDELRSAIETMVDNVETFGSRVRGGELTPSPGQRFERLLQIGIGGSALGPQLAADALSQAGDPLSFDVVDNTDPEGIERATGRDLSRTLIVVVSKSGRTPETRNGLIEATARLTQQGLDPARHLVAVTGEGSELDQRARAEGWLGRFPIWDWVGGRTSQTAAVGLLPMAILGHDVRGLLDGAREMDQATRVPDRTANPAARLALAWHVATGGHGKRDMVVIPYKDRLQLFSRYLQQLVMESLGKRHDLSGDLVEQGIVVYGNKGSTDQHAYVQQLRDGLDNFFATLIGVVEDGVEGAPIEVEPEVRSGDYLLGFLLGTRRALVDRGRDVITILVPRVDARTLGGLIALYERTVGLYASLIRVNAYHQPGVEAGKKAAASVLALQTRLIETLRAEPGTWKTAAMWAQAAGQDDLAVEAWWLLERFARHERFGIQRRGEPADPEAEYALC